MPTAIQKMLSMTLLSVNWTQGRCESWVAPCSGIEGSGGADGNCCGGVSILQSYPEGGEAIYPCRKFSQLNTISPATLRNTWVSCDRTWRFQSLAQSPPRGVCTGVALEF